MAGLSASPDFGAGSGAALGSWPGHHDSDADHDPSDGGTDNSDGDGYGDGNSRHADTAHPRVWLITAATSPLGLGVARALLERGDAVVAARPAWHGQAPKSGEDDVLTEAAAAEAVLEAELETLADDAERLPGQLLVVDLDTRSAASSQAAVAQAVAAFGALHVLLCCSSEALVGTIEEIGQSEHARALTARQMQTNFFGPVNVIKAALPCMRRQHDGHILAVTGITGHIGTPGLAALCSSQWALEGYCDSLAYEVAPFGVRVTIFQNNIEVGLLTNRLASVPSLGAYLPGDNPAPLVRNWLGKLGSRLAGDETWSQRNLFGAHGQSSFYVDMSPATAAVLAQESVTAIIAIGGRLDPPARHIIGHAGVAAVGEKLRTVSEELEDFVGVSVAVDY